MLGVLDRLAGRADLLAEPAHLLDELRVEVGDVLGRLDRFEVVGGRGEGVLKLGGDVGDLIRVAGRPRRDLAASVWRSVWIALTSST